MATQSLQKLSLPSRSNAIDLESEQLPSAENFISRSSKKIKSFFNTSLANSIKNLIQDGSRSSLTLALKAVKTLNTMLPPRKFGNLARSDDDDESHGGCLSKLLKVSLMALVLSPWYMATGKKREKPCPHYQVPAAVRVIDTDLPTITQNIVKETEDINGNPVSIYEPVKAIDTAAIDFSQDFTLETERYKIIKNEDFLLSRPIGHLNSCFTKIFFCDWACGSGFDADATKEVIAMLEANPEIDGLTVRINNNGVWHDCARLFFDEEVRSRNNFIARVAIGLPTTFCGELFAELRRGDYYNPMSQTVILYSDIQSVSAHEIGHHQDFQRFDSDWEYSIARAFPPAMLYQEWQASDNACDIMAKEDGWQFYRFLLPAFSTYLLGSYLLSKRMLMRSAAASDNYYGDYSDIGPGQVLRHMATQNTQLYSGILAYSALVGMGAPFLLGAGGFAGAFVGSKYLADNIMEKVVPYAFENR